MPGRSNRANAVLAVAAAAHLGVGVDSALAAIRLLESISGRYARGTVGAVPVRLLLAKNPAGWQEMLEQTASAAGPGTPSPLVLTLNARLADGKDTSWIWDVPFEKLADRVVWAAGERATDLALRLRYAGVQCRYTPEPLAAVAEAAAYAEGRVVDVLANYTAFLGIRDKMGPS
jgi:UDP-N-acetylmuramyl tripeptide synthase